MPPGAAAATGAPPPPGTLERLGPVETYKADFPTSTATFTFSADVDAAAVDEALRGVGHERIVIAPGLAGAAAAAAPAPATAKPESLVELVEAVGDGAGNFIRRLRDARRAEWSRASRRSFGDI